jgi:hypothetical protein
MVISVGNVWDVIAVYIQSTTDRLITPGRYQQNAQLIWSSPLTEVNTVGHLHNIAATTILLVLTLHVTCNQEAMYSCASD